MTERKKIKQEKNRNELEVILATLVNTPQSAELTGEIQNILSELVSMLYRATDQALVVQAIAEILRITAPRSALGNAELASYFEVILRLLPKTRLSLEMLVRYRIPALLKDLKLISQFFDILGKVSHNKDYLEDILAIFVEENPDCHAFIDRLFDVRPFPSVLLSRISSNVNIQTLSEDKYIAFFVNCLANTKSCEIRIVKGRNRLQFVEAAVVNYNAEISSAYVGDKDRKVRCVIASHCRSADIFARLLNDHDEDVRISLLRGLHWKDAIRYNISERLLDKCFKVREIMYLIYEEGAYENRESEIFERNTVVNGKLNFPNSNKGVLNIRRGLPHEESSAANGPSERDSKENQSNTCQNQTRKEDGHDDKKEEITVLRSFIMKLFEGCLTVYKNEYVRLLRNSGFTMAFLHESRDKPGAPAFLETLEMKEYRDIPKEFKGFCLEFTYKGSLSHEEILECLENNVFEVLKHIKSPQRYYSILFEKAKVIDDFCAVESIVEVIKGYLVTVPFMSKAEDNTTFTDTYILNDSASSPHDSVPSNFYYINAHTKCPPEFIESQFQDFSYHVLYFLVHQARNDSRLREALVTATLTTCERISLLLYLNDVEFLSSFAHLLIQAPLDARMHRRILRSKNVSSALIYFLSTGLVNVRNVLFFIKCVKLAMHCRTRDGVRHVFAKYVNAVDQASFDVFYSVCWELREYITGDCPSDAAGASATSPKLRLRVNDQMLHYICDLIIGMRSGTLVEIKIDLTKHGFVHMSENEIEMVRYNQVLYCD